MHRLTCCGPAGERRLLQALGELGLRLNQMLPVNHTHQPPPLSYPELIRHVKPQSRRN
jgi:hypothetical protein